MQGTGIIANPKVIPIDKGNNKYSVSFQFQIPNAPPDNINIPGIFFGSGSLAIFNNRNVSSAIAMPPINNIQGSIQWDDTTPNVIGPLLIYVPTTGELVTIQPENPQTPSNSAAVHCQTSFSVPLLPCEEIWLIKTNDSGTAHPSNTNINLIVSTFDRPIYRNGV